MKHNPRCPFCGAPTRTQPFRDRTAYQCTECASLCVGPEVASELLLVMTGTPAGAPTRRAPRRTRSMPLVTLALALLFLLLAVPVAVAVFGVVRGPVADPTPLEVPVVVTLPPQQVVPVPPPAPPPAPEVQEVEEPAPDVVPAAPGPAAPRSAKASIDLGWKRIDGDPSGAANAFRAALEREPANAEAKYGLGYALLQTGDSGGGARWLCGAREGANRELRREIDSLIAHNSLACP